MRVRLRLFGVTVVSLTIDTDLTSEPSGITGGTSHNFEIAHEPEDVYEERLGFRALV